MAHSNTIMSQLTRAIPRHVFDKYAAKNHAGQKFRSYNRWSQFVAMLTGQLSGRKSLRDIVENLYAQKNRLYHLGMKPTSRATLARVNEKQPATLYQELYFYLLSKYQHNSPKHKFSFENKVYLLDATIIDLCLAAFPWAEYRQKKRAIKLHIGLDAEGYLPNFINMSNGKISDIEKARPFQFPKGAFVVFDRGLYGL